MTDQLQIGIAGEPDVVRAVIEAARMAEHCGFAEDARQMIATAVSELARNILKYAGRGTVHLSAVAGDGRIGVEVIAEDRGPGIIDVDRAMRDSYSSGGTLGLGLPGVERMMDEFEITSTPGAGTRVKARKWC